MPELPEVEVSRLGITPHIQDQIITDVIVRQPKLRWPVPEEVNLAKGLKLNAVRRRAKYLLLDTDNGSIILHLGMSGKLRVVDKNTPLIKHDHIDIQFNNHKVLRYNDTRRFGAMLWQDKTQDIHPVMAKLGPEPLTDEFCLDYVFEKSRGKNTAIKQFVMDNAVVVGVGNIYANESLFKARIHPKKPAGKVSKASYKKLVPIIKSTLEKAIEQGGTTLKDFAQADGSPGYFAQELLAYGRGGKPCVECETPLEEMKIGQRTTVFCPNCQQ